MTFYRIAALISSSAMQKVLITQTSVHCARNPCMSAKITTVAYTVPQMVLTQKLLTVSYDLYACGTTRWCR